MIHSAEVFSGERFRFGENWSRFLSSVDEDKIKASETALISMLGDIRGKTFLDVGCGSGLSSLAARRLGAKVSAFDYDPQSVACAVELQTRYGLHWPAEEGSALDVTYLSKLGQFDILYSWGVLHHTGDMWKALGNMIPLVKDDGRLFISLYNDQGLMSSYWRVVKKLFNTGAVGRLFITAAHLPYFLARLAARTIKGRRLERGMNLWRDYIDWLGGYPFEVATPNAVIDFFTARGLRVERTRRVGRKSGCNEFVFTR